MSQFENVSVIREANIYFDGQVTSRTVIFQDGTEKTLGIMMPGEYEFNTANKELMEILVGTLEYKLPGAQWTSVRGGESFEVPGNSTFKVRVIDLSDYCCSYID